MNKHVIKVLGILWVGHFLVDFMLGIWPVYKTMAGVNLAVAGIIAGFSAFIGEGMQLLFGSWGDRGYNKPIVLLGVVLATASAFLAYTTEPWVLFVLFLLTCMGSGAFHPTAVGVITEYQIPKRGMIIGLFASGGGLGLALSQIIFSQSYSFLSGQMIYLAIPSILLILYGVYYPFSQQNRCQLKSKKRLSWNSFRRFFSHRELTALYITQVCNQSLYWTALFLLPDILKGRDYPEWISYGGAHLFLVLGATLAMTPGGWLAERYSLKKLLVICTCTSTTLLALFLGYDALPNGIVIALLFVLGGAYGVVSPVSVHYGNRLAPNDPGLISGFLMGFAWSLAECLGPTSGGILSTIFQEHAAEKALACVGLLSIGNVIAANMLHGNAEVLIGEEHEKPAIV